jgi:membrane protein
LHQADRHNLPFLASALTFDALLASIPFLLILLVGLTHVAHLSPGSTSEDVRQLFQRLVPPASADNGSGPFALIEAWLLGLVRSRGTISLLAIPLFLWFATRLFASVRTALTLLYDVPRRPDGRPLVVGYVLGYLGGKLRDAMMVLVTVALLVGNALLSTGFRMLGVRGGELLLTELLAFAFLVSVFYIVYRHASPRRLPRRAALAGSVFTAALFEVAKRLFSWYLHNVAVVNRFSTDANLGAVVLFVLWLYYTALVFLLGAVVAEAWDISSRQRAAASAGG